MFSELTLSALRQGIGRNATGPTQCIDCHLSHCGRPTRWSQLDRGYCLTLATFWQAHSMVSGLTLSARQRVSTNICPHSGWPIPWYHPKHNRPNRRYRLTFTHTLAGSVDGIVPQYNGLNQRYRPTFTQTLLGPLNVIGCSTTGPTNCIDRHSTMLWWAHSMILAHNTTGPTEGIN